MEDDKESGSRSPNPDKVKTVVRSVVDHWQELQRELLKELAKDEDED